jgi:hypothetical protein
MAGGLLAPPARMQRLRGAGRVNASALPPSPRLVQTLDQFLSPLVAHDPQNMRAANWAFSITERRHNQTDPPDVGREPAGAPAAMILKNRNDPTTSLSETFRLLSP